MIDGLTSTFTPHVLSALVIVLAWLIERTSPLPSSIDPISFFRFICTRMALKVLPPSQQTQQHYISGLLALLMLILPTVVIVFLVSQVASYSWLLDGIILLICLQFSQHTIRLKRIQKALPQNKKQLARDYLQPGVLRDTAPLSTLGICKASIEMYLLRLHYQQAVVLLCFVLAGPIAALSYRLCYETQQIWNVKLAKFERFGFCSHFISSVVQFIPVRLFTLFMHLMSASIPVQRMFSSQHFFATNGKHIIGSAAMTLNLTLDGPVYYEGVKIRRERVQMPLQASTADLAKCISLSDRTMLLYLLVMLILSWIIHQ